MKISGYLWVGIDKVRTWNVTEQEIIKLVKLSTTKIIKDVGFSFLWINIGTFFILKNQQFITWGTKADCGSYFVTMYKTTQTTWRKGNRKREKKEEEKWKEKRT